VAPLYLDHATLDNADLPLAVAMLLGGIGLAGWVESGERSEIVGGAVALGAAAWIKLDGMYLGAGMLGVALLVRLVVYRRDRSHWRPVLTEGLLAGAIFAALVVPWVGYTRLLGLSDLPALAALQHDGWALFWEGLVVIGAEVLFSYNNSSMGLLGGGYGAFWFVCFGGLVVGWRRLRNDTVLWFLLLVVAGGCACYLAVYTVRPYFSVERYLLHLAPLVLLAAARAGRGALDSVPPIPRDVALHVSATTPPASRPRPQRTHKGRRV
jgi:hypothetical protein